MVLALRAVRHAGGGGGSATIPLLIDPQATEMLKGAAGWLVGIGSGLPSASALARRYIWLSVAPWASIAVAMTAQLRTS